MPERMHFWRKTGRVGWRCSLAVFLWWQVFPIFVAGFGANFEFKTLLRFPLNRRTFICWDWLRIRGFCGRISRLLGGGDGPGSSGGAPGSAAVMAGVSVLFVLMNVTLERLIGSWLKRYWRSADARAVHRVVRVVPGGR